MNTSRFLLIDALIIAVIPILFILHGRKRKSPLLRNFNNEKLSRKTDGNFPKQEKLIELEKIAMSQGSGIEFNSLIGNWRFVSVWKKSIDEEDPIFSSLLRVFSARIKFKKEISNETSPNFSVVSSIQFGLFTIEFSGAGYLKGKQPLLPFFLNLIELKYGSNILLCKSLEEPKEKDKSFFSLIALDKNGKWLSARGQSGSVVIWVKD